MIGVNMKITTADNEQVVQVTPRAAINFERHFKIALSKALTDDQRMEYIYFLAYEALKATGATVKLFDGWIDTVHNVEFVFDKGDTTPGKDATT
jgi:hypothetical protein